MGVSMRNVLISLLLLTFLVGCQTAIVRQAKIKKFLISNFIKGIKSSKFIILVSILLVIGGGCMEKNSRDYSTMQNKGKVLVEYRLFGGEPPGINNVLTIYKTGFSTYLQTAPTFFDDERDHEAGYYESQIDLREANSFIEMLQKAVKKIPKRVFDTDEVIAKYRFIEQGKESSFAVSQREIPEDVWNKTNLIIQKLMGKPVWTINLEAYNIGDNDSLDLKFVMKNRGNQTIQISNPWAQSVGAPSHTNFIIDGFAAEYNKTDYWPSEEDNLIRWMNIHREVKQDKEEPFINLAPKEELVIQYTPEKLIEFCKKKKCFIEGRYEGDVKVPGREALRVSIYSNMIEVGEH